MNNRSIAWWLRRIGLPQYTKTLECEYYGLEGLQHVTDAELRDAGVEDPTHRERILNQLSTDRRKMEPQTGVRLRERRVSRKYSLGSSLDLVKPGKDMFRQSVLPRLQREHNKQRLSASCSQLRPLEDDRSQDNKRSKRRSVTAYLSQLKLFGGRREMDLLKKELEEEMKLGTDDPRSHAWYHGPLPREAAETLFERDGDFLVRDSSSSSGDYVLSCYWMNGPMHFKIIRVVLRPKKGYTRELFQFEEDRFDNVPALIRYYVGGRRPISQASGAVIFHPITRTLPLRVIAEQHAGSSKAGGEKNGAPNKRRSLCSTHTDSLLCVNPLLRSGSQPANMEHVGRGPPLQSAQSDSNLRTATDWAPRSQGGSMGRGRLISQYAEGGGTGETGEDWQFQRPHVESGSCFQLDQFESLLLPENNRPLDPSILLALKELFNRSDANTTALHVLSVDCQVARVVGVSEEQKRLMGVGSGLELVTLPHGHQLRQDLLERHHLLALGVAVDVLGCTGTVSQRATVLHKFILLAQALKDHAHDLYSFSAVMKALDMSQVVRLQMTWRALRRNHTESAVLYEKKLKPFMNSLNEGDESVVQGPVAVPHLIPLLMLMEGEDPVENSDRGCQLLYDLLQSARSIAVHAEDYQSHAHSLLSGGWEPVPELLEACRTEFALRLLWGHAGATASRNERYEKFDKILCVLSDKLEPVEVTPHENDLLT
ncbi:breast cancer anti-estrogen resistance protein 3 [Cynoglossus semilaevis]|uniref:breast cancer anti-estrogen resistance protein 3 n=1 Tax=Cynoglossus semilaevis TaxID=244447 RepID=UPI000D628870|nr:breast cancer anti-estrogen resistance protein 3 [Cynoglossus semilaevis]